MLRLRRLEGRHPFVFGLPRCQGERYRPEAVRSIIFWNVSRKVQVRQISHQRYSTREPSHSDRYLDWDS